MKKNENSLRPRWIFGEILMTVSGLLFFAAFAVQEKDLSFPLIGKIFLIGGVVSFSISFIGMLIKKEKMSLKHNSNEV